MTARTRRRFDVVNAQPLSEREVADRMNWRPSANLALSEAAFQQQIVDLCHVLHLYVYHTHDSRRSEAGFLDLTIITPWCVAFWEIKTEKGKVTLEQRAVITRLEALQTLTAGRVRVAVMRPSDMASGRIPRELQEIARCR